jgi:hypothetical protein
MGSRNITLLEMVFRVDEGSPIAEKQLLKRLRVTAEGPDPDLRH